LTAKFQAGDQRQPRLARPGRGVAGVGAEVGADQHEHPDGEQKPHGLHHERLHGTHPADQRATYGGPDQESERPDDRERGLALHEVGGPDQPGDRAEGGGVDEHPPRRHAQAGSEDERHRKPVGRAAERDGQRQRRRGRRLAGGRHDHDPASRQAVAEIARREPQKHIGQGADQVGGAGQRPRAAGVQHQPGKGDQRDAATDRVHQLGDQVEQAVA
jgi:hypothetical protein